MPRKSSSNPFEDLPGQIRRAVKADCEVRTSKRAATAKGIDDVVKASLNVLDCDLSPEQRAIADQIYDLANRLESTLNSKEHYSERS